ncbi:MAG: hydroxyacid dehydrogenase [Cyanobacteria bacterium SIG28]|nr:hydroxyacid dehydrogenase [Cyanobacteria bacterium SIG28]
MKMLMFDYRESESEFFEKNDFPDFDITFIKEPLNEMTNLTDEQYEETDIISVFINSSVTEEVIKKFKNLRIIATRSTGYNHIDLKTCTQNNIAVFNVEQYGRAAVAEYTIGLIINLVRNILPAYLDVQKNLVNHPKYEGRNLSALTLGIVGCGSIGAAVAKIAKSFGMKVLTYSYMKNSDVNDILEYVSLDELLSNSDIITLHIPYTKDTYHFLGKNEFNKIKDGTYIINTARGELIDLVALYENMLNGKIKGAALDVLECEYKVLYDEILNNSNEIDQKCITSAFATQKLLGMNNVIITPHIAYNTKESVETLLENTFNNIRDYIKGEHHLRVC